MGHFLPTCVINDPGAQDIKLTAHFALSEFDCECGENVPEKFHGSVNRLCVNLERLRERLNGAAIVIKSGYRCAECNALTPGAAPKSRHLIASECDFRIAGRTSYEVAEEIENMINGGDMEDGGLHAYADGHVHYGPRFDRAGNPRRARW